MHRWCNGNMFAFQAIALGSIPRRCNPRRCKNMYRFINIMYRFINIKYIVILY